MEFRSRRSVRFWWVQGVTLLRLPLAMVFAAGIGGGLATSNPGVGEGTPSTVWILVLLAMELTDVADGYLARRLGVVSPWGQLFDPYVDSLSRLVVFWGLAQVGWMLAVLPLIMATRDITVAYARLLLTRAGASVAARWSGKAKAWVQGLGALAATALGTTGNLSTMTLWVLSLTVGVVTLASGLDYGYAAYRASRAAGDD